MKRNLLLFLSLCIYCSAKGQSPITYHLAVAMERVNEKAYYRKYKKFFDNKATSGVSIDLDRIRIIASRNEHLFIPLENENATVAKIKSSIEEIGKKIAPGDTFIFYFTGHGDVLEDKNGDEKSGFDQALVAYDDFLVDDDIYTLLNTYFTKSNNIMIVDACHSSTTYKAIDPYLFARIRRAEVLKKYENAIEEDQKQNYDKNGVCAFGRKEGTNELFNLIYLGATEDSQGAQGDSIGGLLTISLDTIINGALLAGNWENFTYPSLACELAASLELEHQIFQYHQIGKSVNKYAETTPFKKL